MTPDRLAVVALGLAVSAACNSSTALVDGAPAHDSAGDASSTTDASHDGAVTPSCNAFGTAGVLDVAAGGVNTCAVRTDRTLWCWGANSHGQLGDGTTNEQLIPTQVTALGNQVLRAAIGSDSHVCAIMLDHTVRCAGDNDAGALGDGTHVGSSVFVSVADLTDVAEVGAGTNLSCARKTDGTVWCWGQNDFGQNGDGTMMERDHAVQVTALGTAVAQIAVGWIHACARKTDGTVWCWGSNGAGMLGDGTFTNSPTPVRAGTLTTASTLTSGAYDTCARTSDGADWCWGADHDGQLDDGTMIGPGLPVAITALGTDVADGDEGFSSTWARKTDNSVWYWGFGVLTGVTQVANLQAATLVTGDDHQCIVDLGGALRCWGTNLEGQLGDGTKMGRPDPILVPLPCP